MSVDAILNEMVELSERRKAFPRYRVYWDKYGNQVFEEPEESCDARHGIDNRLEALTRSLYLLTGEWLVA